MKLKLVNFVVFLLCTLSTLAGNPTYKLKFGEDFRSVALKYGIAEGVLVDLNPNIPSRYALSKDPAFQIIKSAKTKVILPKGAKILTNWDKDTELEIFLENMRLYVSVENEDTLRNNKDIYKTFLKRMCKDFGFETYKAEYCETLSVVGMKYKNALPEFERLNPIIAHFMAKGMFDISDNSRDPSDLDPCFDLLTKWPYVMPKNLTLADDQTISKKLWSLNLAKIMEGSYDNPHTKRAMKVYRNRSFGYSNSVLVARLLYRVKYSEKKKDYGFLKFEMERIFESENDGTLQLFGYTQERLEELYKSVCETVRIKKQLDAEKRVRRRQFWANLGMATLQAVAQTSQQMVNAYYGGSMGYTPNYYVSPTFSMSSVATPYFEVGNYSNYTIPSLNYTNFNAGLNAAIITANSQARLNQSWNDFQTSMANFRPYTFEEIQQMNVDAFNTQFGLNFTQEQYNNAVMSWSNQGAVGSAIGGVDLPERPSDSNGNWESYYRDSYARWERHAEETYKSLTLFGSSNTTETPSGTVGNRGNAGGSTVSLKMNLYDIQRQMRQTRMDAKKNGVIITPSRWEDATVSL